MGVCAVELEAKYVCGVSEVACGRQLYTREPDCAGRAGVLIHVAWDGRAICGSKPPAWCIPDSVCRRSNENELACENAECV